MRNGKQKFMVYSNRPAAVIAAMAAASVLFAQAPTKKVIAHPSEVVVVIKNSIEPPKITRPSGPFVLYLENRTDNVTESFRVDDEAQASEGHAATSTGLATLATKDQKWWDHALINLPPGTYRLSLLSRTDLTLQLVITK